ncbi:MAG: hypothetical protein AAGK17_08605, partial [Pseudomonadota bacterium]
MRAFVSAIVFSSLLIACSSEELEPQDAANSSEAAPEETGEAEPLSEPDQSASDEDASEEEIAEDVAAASESATPMAERVATLGLLNKRNNVSIDLEMKPGETREEGPIIITLAACE